ncbi:unnamed protein product [Peniophora sp. CBMAI 1063]|nr:unnamed protein product [Peniophora sp. CBMAI 1063]
MDRQPHAPTSRHEDDELDLAISAREHAVNSLPQGHPKAPDRLHSLGYALWTRYLKHNHLNDLERAVNSYRLVVDLTPKDRLRSKPARLDSLGLALHTRFRRRGDFDDLAHAIEVQQLAVSVTSDCEPQLLARLDSLGNSLAVRYDRRGDMHDIQTAIEVQHRASELALNDHHPDRPRFLNNLGNSFLARFQRSGELIDLRSGIEKLSCAVEITPDGHPALPVRLNSLGLALRVRFERLYELEDLEGAIRSQRRAVELTPDKDPQMPVRVTSLGTSLSLRAMRLGTLEDLEWAITAKQSALDLTPTWDPSRPARLETLGLSLVLRYERMKDLKDLHRAIEAHESALELTPPDHPARPARLDHFGVALELRFQHCDTQEDLDRAIALQQEAVDLTESLDYPQKHICAFNLGISLRLRFGSQGDLGDLERAIQLQRRTIENTPSGHPQRVVQLQELGFSLVALFKHSKSKLRFDAAITCLMKVTMEPLGDPTIRLESAQEVVSLLSEHNDFGSADSLLRAHSQIIEVFPEIVWLGHNVDRRYKESAKLGTLVNAAVAAFIKFDSRYQAIEWMETGRSLVWSQILALRTPLDDLQAEHSDLALRLKEVAQDLQHCAPISGSIAGSGDQPVETTVETRRQLVNRYERILSEVRQCAGFHDFLRSPKIASLLEDIEQIDGPVVFININTSRCDALVLSPNGSIQHIPLHSLTEERAGALRAAWIRCLRSSASRDRGVIAPQRLMIAGQTDEFGYVLKSLWTLVVSPILVGMGMVNADSFIRLPHVTWCPTGPLTQLPLHAAGSFDFINASDDQPHVYDYVVSSYIPSLAALLRCSKGHRRTAQPDLLVVTQPATPGWPTLRGTLNECARLRELLPESRFLEHDAATVAETRKILSAHSWLHFACHGLQKSDDPTQSAFALYDGYLTLSDLMNIVSDDAELAFLSACQTAAGDEKIPEESAHLAAGMLAVGFRGVVATMWSITDADAPIVVQAYYQKLLELRGSHIADGRGRTWAAYALHHAVRVLREYVGERNFVKWAPFVHVGV